MTIGERIQKKRKEAGLSQEELGAKLNVSRQAVYKWENDQSLPEMNNLIAMAEILNVKVGWLINEESDSQDDDLQKTLQNILNAQSQKTGRRKLLYACSAAAAVIAGWFLLSRIASLENRYMELQQTIAMQTQQIRDEVSSITARVQNALETYNSLTVNNNVTIDHYDYQNNTVTISLSAQPKSFTEETEAVFHIHGEQDFSFEAVKNGHLYTAQAEIPLTDDTLEVSLELIQGEERQTALLDVLDHLASNTFPYVDMQTQPVSSDSYGFTTEYDIIVTLEYDSSRKIPEITQISAYIYDGDQMITEIPINQKKTGRVNKPYNPQLGQTIFSVTKDMKFGKVNNFAVHIEVQDTYGRIMTLVNDDYGTHYEFN